MFEKTLHQNVTNLPILAAIGGSMLMAASASATYIIADNFNDRNGQGLSGTPVTTSISTPAEIWGAPNASQPRLTNSRLTVGNVSNAQTAYVDIPEFTAPESEPIVRVSAEINVGLANWIQVSLGNQGGTNPLTQTQLAFVSQELAGQFGQATQTPFWGAAVALLITLYICSNSLTTPSAIR